MQLGIIGLGKMGGNLALQANEKKIAVIGKARSKKPELEKQGIKVVDDYESFVDFLKHPRIVYLSLPAGPTVDSVLNELVPFLEEGDVLMDGGNSFYLDSIEREKKISEKGIYFLDCGTSGGTEGALHGVCAMIGGDRAAFGHCEPLFKDISVKDGYLYCGPSGSGHFVKMIHNGIEYGMMQSIAEGFEVLHKSEFGLDLRSVAKVWNHGSVVRSWLMELTENALSKDPNLDAIKGVMHSSGEGKWTVETALELQAATPVIAMSLMMRYRSLDEDTFSGKVVAALRNEFGGHAVVKR